MPRFAMHFYKNTTLDKLLDSFYKTADKEQQLKVSHQIQSIVAENQVTIPVMSGAYMYQYNTRRFSGWWSEDNPHSLGRPSIWAKVPERLLHDRLISSQSNKEQEYKYCICRPIA